MIFQILIGFSDIGPWTLRLQNAVAACKSQCSRRVNLRSYRRPLLSQNVVKLFSKRILRLYIATLFGPYTGGDCTIFLQINVSSENHEFKNPMFWPGPNSSSRGPESFSDDPEVLFAEVSAGEGMLRKEAERDRGLPWGFWSAFSFEKNRDFFSLAPSIAGRFEV